MNTYLLLTNLPYNCSDRELKHWVESRGFQTGAIRIVRDFVAGSCPAVGYVEILDVSASESMPVLNGKKLRQQNVCVTVAAARSAAGKATM